MKKKTKLLAEGTRSLVAIMFTDIVGYTAIMQEDEQIAKEQRQRHRDVLEANITAYQGRILQHFGDGTLTIFSSAIHAVSCAVLIQQELQKEPVIPLRIGLHQGDIVFNEEGAYGDSVNIASRIESLAVPGSVLISYKVYDDIKNQPGLPVTSLGNYELKNIKDPIEIFALTNKGLIVPHLEDISGKTKDNGIGLAVLPFTNISSDPENETFTDGITEDLIAKLSNIEGIQVKSSTSSFAFKGKNIDVREIGVKLDVTHIIEGSVRKEGDTVRITVQLVDANDGNQLWAETFDREVENVLKIQDEISQHISEKLQKEPLEKSGVS